MRQEQKRFVVLNRRLLDQRESFKLEKQRGMFFKKPVFLNILNHNHY